MEERIIGLSEELLEYRYLTYYDKTKENRYINYKLQHSELSWEDIITRVEIGLDYTYYCEVESISFPDIFFVLVNKYRQLSREYIPGDLEVIAPEYNSSTLMLRHSARIAFEEMCQAAVREGYILKAISTFRSFLYQNQVYYKNWLEEQPLEQYQAERDRVSARAGHSEHQTGLAVDINDLEQTFEYTPEGIWLREHCYEYGFILRYPKGKEDITGYDYEPWHFRYLGKEMAYQLQDSGMTYDEYYVRNLRNAD
ncbi:MAG: yodJ [Herbinix sp.]|jgi:LAS superfamily LD-carboxypeptidase LdcB|nr:yodJ [Herbinix sp.]